ncbi:MAG: hypothetical protein IK044_05940 [Methanobrevibacter sp.]|nr:hypothetical protein [Methanobrevibacter sp.]
MCYKVDEKSQKEVREFRKNNQDMNFNHPNKWVRRLIAKKTSDEDILKNYALNDSFYRVRKEALRKITDEIFLSEIVFLEKNNEVKRLALRKIKNPDILENIAQKDSNWHIRSLLFDYISDEKTLAAIAENDPHPSIRLKALSKIDDEKLFESISLNDSSYKVRMFAVGRLTNEEILRDIAINDENTYVRVQAISNPNLNDEKLFGNFALNDVSENIKIACVKRIENEEILYKIAVRNTFGHVSSLACKKIHSDELLLKVSEESQWYGARTLAVSKIKSEQILLDLLKNGQFIDEAVNAIEDESTLKQVFGKGFPNESKLYAMYKLNSPCPLTQEELFELIVNGSVKTRRIAATKFYTSQILLDFWDENPSDLVRRRIIFSLTNDNLLNKIVSKEEDKELITFAIAQIDDERILRRSIYNSDNPLVKEVVLEIKTYGKDCNMPYSIPGALNKAHKKYVHVMGQESFKHLDELIRSGKKEIVLDSDIVLKDGEELLFLNGIELDIDGMIINGDGHSIDACGKTRIFNVTGRSIKLQDIVFKNGFAGNGGAIKNDGSLKIYDSTFEENRAEESGGAIFNEGGLFISKSDFKNNKSTLSGGAIYHYGSYGAECDNSSFSHNSAGCLGGAIFNLRKFSIYESDFRNNQSDGCGGAIYNHRKCKVSCECANFSNNSSKCLGGAIGNFGIFKIENCDLKDNSSKKGGAIFTNPPEHRLIPNTRCVRTYCDLMVMDCTFKDNEADDVFESKERLC